MRKQYLLILVGLLFLGPLGWGASTNTVPPACKTTPLNAGDCGVPATLGTMVRVTDATSSTTCTSGGGSNVNLCVYNGSAWVIATTELVAMTMPVDLCGQNDENGTIYFGPHLTDNWLENENDVTDGSIGGSICDGLDNATEGTADAPLTGIGAYGVRGMYCITDGTLGAGETLVFTARSAVADLTPSITCSLAAGETSCVSITTSTTDVAAGATVAVEAVQASNNSDDNSWCRLYVSPKAGSF